MDIERLYKIYLESSGVTTDTRKIENGNIFFALKGPAYNGNAYTKNAFENGASYCVCDEDVQPENEKVILVEDVLKTLQQLAFHHRLQFNIPVIAVTGSNGKTTTKELIHAALSMKYKTYTTEGNLNNHIGIPLTLLKIRRDAEMAIVEMGANHLGEIKDYCSYTAPTHGLITNCGKAHIEGFGSEENVRKGKGELYDHIRSTNGTAFVWADDNKLIDLASGISSVVTYGIANADHTGNTVSGNELMTVKMNNGLEIKTNLVGDYNLPNVLAAVAIARTFDVKDEDIKNALENYTPSNSRSQLVMKDSNRIILDAYNANPTSMKAAIENMSRMQAENKILILGAMKELGNDSSKDHQEIISLINKYNWKHVVLVGDEFPEHNGIIKFENSTQAMEWYRAQNFVDSLILIKGSRGMQMEKVIQ